MTPKDSEPVDSSTGSIFSASSYCSSKSKENSIENGSIKKDFPVMVKKDFMMTNVKKDTIVTQPSLVLIPTTALSSVLVRPPLGPNNIKRMALSNPKNSGTPDKNNMTTLLFFDI